MRRKYTMDVDLRLGFMWTRNLWNRGYVTYMTAPVTWMIGDVLAGGALLVLSAYRKSLGGKLYPSMLRPVEKYERPKPERPAMGTGLDAEIR